MAADDITLYFWPTPNGQKVAIMLEEIGEPYEVRYVDLDAGAQHDPAYLKISPNGKMPAIVDPDGPDGNALSIFESGAILQYLGRKYERFYPVNERRKAEVNQWLFWQIGGLGPMCGQALHFRKYAKEKVHYGIERYTKEVARLFGVMEQRLTGRTYLAHEYSIADIACFPFVRRHEDLGIDMAHYPAISAWFGLLAGRESVQRAIALGQDPATRINT